VLAGMVRLLQGEARFAALRSGANSTAACLIFSLTPTAQFAVAG
jgi:hypothetical protein